MLLRAQRLSQPLRRLAGPHVRGLASALPESMELYRKSAQQAKMQREQDLLANAKMQFLFGEKAAMHFEILNEGTANQYPKLSITDGEHTMMSIEDRGTTGDLLVTGDGLFGGEEKAVILPAIEAARTKGFDVEGPIPPDTAFLPDKRRATDLFVCMYHDQGHIPLKALCFDEAVNITLGLPIVRTSVDHGTALDIAGLGQANPSSLFEAVKLALKFI